METVGTSYPKALLAPFIREPRLISLILVLYGSVLDGLLQFVRCGEVAWSVHIGFRA